MSSDIAAGCFALKYRYSPLQLRARHVDVATSKNLNMMSTSSTDNFKKPGEFDGIITVDRFAASGPEVVFMANRFDLHACFL